MTKLTWIIDYHLGLQIRTINLLRISRLSNIWRQILSHHISLCLLCFYWLFTRFLINWIRRLVSSHKLLLKLLLIHLKWSISRNYCRLCNLTVILLRIGTDIPDLLLLVWVSLLMVLRGNISSSNTCCCPSSFHFNFFCLTSSNDILCRPWRLLMRVLIINTCPLFCRLCQMWTRTLNWNIKMATILLHHIWRTWTSNIGTVCFTQWFHNFGLLLYVY